MPALERLAEAQRVEASADHHLQRLAETGIDVMPELTVEYVTRFAHQHQVDPPRRTEAIYLPDRRRAEPRAAHLEAARADSTVFTAAPLAIWAEERWPPREPSSEGRDVDPYAAVPVGGRTGDGP